MTTLLVTFWPIRIVVSAATRLTRLPSPSSPLQPFTRILAGPAGIAVIFAVTEPPSGDGRLMTVCGTRGLSSV